MTMSALKLQVFKIFLIVSLVCRVDSYKNDWANRFFKLYLD